MHVTKTSRNQPQEILIGQVNIVWSAPIQLWGNGTKLAQRAFRCSAGTWFRGGISKQSVQSIMGATAIRRSAIPLRFSTNSPFFPEFCINGVSAGFLRIRWSLPFAVETYRRHDPPHNPMSPSSAWQRSRRGSRLTARFGTRRSSGSAPARRTHLIGIKVPDQDFGVTSRARRNVPSQSRLGAGR
jgi:hypothetical protein